MSNFTKTSQLLSEAVEDKLIKSIEANMKGLYPDVKVTLYKKDTYGGRKPGDGSYIFDITKDGKQKLGAVSISVQLGKVDNWMPMDANTQYRKVAQQIDKVKI